MLAFWVHNFSCDLLDLLLDKVKVLTWQFQQALEFSVIITGEVVAVNEDLPSAPETANSDPYGAGWFFKIKPANPADYDGLLTAEQYAGEVD